LSRDLLALQILNRQRERALRPIWYSSFTA
jgi:hypothetical protein